MEGGRRGKGGQGRERRRDNTVHRCDSVCAYEADAPCDPLQANALLPPECTTHTHCLPSLVNTATSFEVSAAERGSVFTPEPREWEGGGGGGGGCVAHTASVILMGV